MSIPLSMLDKQKHYPCWTSKSTWARRACKEHDAHRLHAHPHSHPERPHRVIARPKWGATEGLYSCVRAAAKQRSSSARVSGISPAGPLTFDSPSHPQTKSACNTWQHGRATHVHGRVPRGRMETERHTHSVSIPTSPWQCLTVLLSTDSSAPHHSMHTQAHTPPDPIMVLAPPQGSCRHQLIVLRYPPSQPFPTLPNPSHARPRLIVFQIPPPLQLYPSPPFPCTPAPDRIRRAPRRRRQHSRCQRRVSISSSRSVAHQRQTSCREGCGAGGGGDVSHAYHDAYKGWVRNDEKIAACVCGARMWQRDGDMLKCDGLEQTYKRA